ncbi:hypothetical protein D046_0549 [Vibrio parahaemolyticus V-223/04]|nr:hypothetical protein D046_0549 [Vibrio parahaemolyticus V-223/04]
MVTSVDERADVVGVVETHPESTLAHARPKIEKRIEKPPKMSE